MAFLTGKANIQGGHIYGTEFCPLYIGKSNCDCINAFTKATEIHTKHLDVEGVLKITDSNNSIRLELDSNNVFNLKDLVNAEKIAISNNLLTNNADITFTLNELNVFNILRTNVTNNTYACNITSNNALKINGKCNIIGELFINDVLIDTTINTIVDNKLDTLTSLKLNSTNDLTGIFINTSLSTEPHSGSGLIWKNNKFNLLTNLEYSNKIISNPSTDEYSDLCSKDNYVSSIYKKIHTYDLSTITANITNIDSSNSSISRLTSTNLNIIQFNLLNPTVVNYATTHQIIADNNFSGNVEISGNIIFPDGTVNSSKKLKITKKGQNVLLTFMCGYWYIQNGGIEIV